MKDILGQLLHACTKLKDANEIAIIDEYRCNAKRYTVALTSKIIFFTYSHGFFLTHKSCQYFTLENRFRQITTVSLCT